MQLTEPNFMDLRFNVNIALNTFLMLVQFCVDSSYHLLNVSSKFCVLFSVGELFDIKFLHKLFALFLLPVANEIWKMNNFLTQAFTFFTKSWSYLHNSLTVSGWFWHSLENAWLSGSFLKEIYLERTIGKIQRSSFHNATFLYIIDMACRTNIFLYVQQGIWSQIKFVLLKIIWNSSKLLSSAQLILKRISCNCSSTFWNCSCRLLFAPATITQRTVFTATNTRAEVPTRGTLKSQLPAWLPTIRLKWGLLWQPQMATAT